MTKAIRIHTHGGPEVMRWEDVPSPEPGHGEALVRHAAVGLNYIDVYFRTGLYKTALPTVLGVEGAVSGSTLKSSTTIGFPAGFPGDQGAVNAKTDFLPSITARFGVAFDRVLLYAKGGVAWAGDQTNVIGSVAGTPFSFQGLDTRTGFTAGGGVDWAFSGPWSVNVEYDYYGFGHGNVFMTDSVNGFTGLVDTKQSIQVVKVGLNFHMWSSDQ